MSVSKKMMNALVLQRNIGLFRCPICRSKMDIVEHARIVCSKNHSFDLSRQGYVNLAPQAHVTKYDQSLFEARKKVIDSGFFNILLHTINESLINYAEKKDRVAILDAGCGEGSHLLKIRSQMPDDTIGVGIDLAKEGIAVAAKTHPGNIWCVADLANCPFGDASFDVVLNILSPANYAEFNRLLKPQGLFIKVVPENDYLKELRALFYKNQERKEMSNPVERFSEQFEFIHSERITYEFPLNVELLRPLIQMTPLSWGADSGRIEEVLCMDIPSMTVDFNVMIGRRRP